MAKQTRTVKRPGSRTPEPARRPAGVPAFDRVAAVIRREGGADPPGPLRQRSTTFGAGALKIGGKIFAMPADGDDGPEAAGGSRRRTGGGGPWKAVHAGPRTRHAGVDCPRGPGGRLAGAGARRARVCRRHAAQGLTAIVTRQLPLRPLPAESPFPRAELVRMPAQPGPPWFTRAWLPCRFPRPSFDVWMKARNWTLQIGD